MSDYDGPTLRSVRESVDVPLRRVARMANMSHGHLSKMERGEAGRPVTPAVLAAYEKATGIRLTNPTSPLPASVGGWQQGALSDAGRRGFNAQVASLAVGGPLGQPGPQLVDSLGPYLLPEHVCEPDTDHIHTAAALVTSLDLTHGGGLTSQLARAALRWAIGLTKTSATSEDAHTRLYAGIGQLAQRTAWAAFDSARHDHARTLFRLSLDAAIITDDRDLRAHVLADIAAQHNHLDHRHDAVSVIELAEADPRISPPVRAVLYSVKARAYAATGQPDQCWRYIDRAEQTLADIPRDVDGWQATIATPAHLYATTGHATAVLARHTNRDTDRDQATRRLTHALEHLDPTTHTRAHTLCALRLATLHVPDDPQQAIHHTTRALLLAGRVRSARLTGAINALRVVAAAHPQPAGTDLVDLINQHREQYRNRQRYPRHDHPRTTETLTTQPNADGDTPTATSSPAT